MLSYGMVSGLVTCYAMQYGYDANNTAVGKALPYAAPLVDVTLCYVMEWFRGWSRFTALVNAKPCVSSGDGHMLRHALHGLRPSGRCKQCSKPLPAVLSHAHVRVDTRYRI